MGKIVRTPTKAAGGITDAERMAMKAHADQWIKRAFRTDPIDPEKIVPAIEGIYAESGLKKPRVVIVPSPLVMAFAYGSAAAIWHQRSTRQATAQATARATRLAADQATRLATAQATYQATAQATDQATARATRLAADQATRLATAQATYQATAQATDQATDQATAQATYLATAQATYQATRLATDKATDKATDQATDQATRLATRLATDQATYQATYQATRLATRLATYLATAQATYQATAQAADQATYLATAQATDAAGACFAMSGALGLACAQRWGGVYQGGNMWSAYDCYLTAARDILGLRLTVHDKYIHWEQAAIHGGFRVMHPEFCIVSDFPEFIRTDENNQPHCETGPSHRWRDGWSLYHWHGTSVPAEWIEDKSFLTAEIALSQENTALRIAAMQIVGWPRMIEQLDARVINRHPEGLLGGELLAVNKAKFNPDERGEMRFLRAECPRNGIICFRVPDDTKTAHEAQAWKAGLPPSIYQLPATRT